MHKLSEWKKSKYFYISILVVVLLAVSLVGGISAKYIHGNNGKNLIAAKDFYFTSNLLTEDGTEYVLNATADSISFTLSNNLDQLRWAAEDIHYTVSLECTNAKEGDAVASLDKTEGTLTRKADSITTDVITVSSLIPGRTYEVVAVGKTGDKQKPNEGYKQTLKATFTVSEGDKKVYKHLDTTNEAYVVLTVWTENVAGSANIFMNTTDTVSDITGFIPDSTDQVLRQVKNYNATDKSYDALAKKHAITDDQSFTTNYSSKTYRFFLDTKEKITVDNFTVQIESNGTVYVAAPDTP